MEKAVATFEKRFAYAGLCLAEGDVIARSRGKLVAASTVVWYLCGQDERGDYLYYYVTDRLSDDVHVRLYADSAEERLPTISTLRRWSPDPEEDKQLAAEYAAENRRVVELLAAKG